MSCRSSRRYLVKRELNTPAIKFNDNVRFKWPCRLRCETIAVNISKKMRNKLYKYTLWHSLMYQTAVQSFGIYFMLHVMFSALITGNGLINDISHLTDILNVNRNSQLNISWEIIKNILQINNDYQYTLPYGSTVLFSGTIELKQSSKLHWILCRTVNRGINHLLSSKR